MKKETRQILDDLKAKGMDISSIENQFRVNPLLEKAGDEIIGGGILRQANYQQYMNKVTLQEKQIQEQARQLATLHDANAQGILPQAALDTMKAMEDALMETGLFTEESIKEISALGRKPLEDLINKPVVLPPARREEDNMGKDIDLSKYVDTETYEKSMGNIALGSIMTNMQITSAFDEIKKLGIEVTPEKVEKVQEAIKQGFAQGNGNLGDIFEKTFEVSKVREAKANEAIEVRIQEEAGKLVAERMKKENLPGRGNFRGSPSPVFGRKRPIYTNSESGQTGYKDAEGNIDISKLPKNSEGDPKLFLTRGDRTSRVAGASDLFNNIMEKAESDPFYLE